MLSFQKIQTFSIMRVQNKILKTLYKAVGMVTTIGTGCEYRSVGLHKNCWQ